MNNSSLDPFSEQDIQLGSRIKAGISSIVPFMSSQQRRINKHHSSQQPSDSRSNTNPSIYRYAWRPYWFTNTAIVAQRRPFSVLAGIFLILYSTVFALVRFGENRGFSDLLYNTNSCLLFAGFGLFFHSGLLIGLSIAFASASHLTFMYDMIVWLFFDIFPLGRAIFLEDTSLSDGIFWTTLHQFWFLPLLAVIIYSEYSGQLRLMKRYLFFSIIINLLLSTLAKTHFEQVMKLPQGEFIFVPDFVTGHELWLEPNTLLHRFDDSSSLLVYLAWSTIISSLMLSGVTYIFLQLFAYVCLEGHGMIPKEKVT